MNKFENGFVVTMAFNEKDALPVWFEHYSKYFEPSSMYVIDHGSDINYVPSGVNRIYVPRYKGFNEDCRRDAVEGLVGSLMQYYDFGLYCDADELILLDEFNPKVMDENEVLFLHGFDLFKVLLNGDQRIYGMLSYGMCKPLLFNKIQPRWSAGFHGTRLETEPKMSMILGHTKYFDLDTYNRNIQNRASAYDSMHQHHKDFGINMHWIDPNTLHRIYNEVQVAINQNCLYSNVSDYKPVWGQDANGYIVSKDTGSPFLLDLTNQFKHLL